MPVYYANFPEQIGEKSVRLEAASPADAALTFFEMRARGDASYNVRIVDGEVLRFDLMGAEGEMMVECVARYPLAPKNKTRYPAPVCGAIPHPRRVMSHLARISRRQPR